MATPSLDARLLAERVFKLDGAGLAAREKERAGSGQIAILGGLCERRLGGEPVARILGSKEFFGLALALGSETLVPRPETELVVETGLAALAGRTQPRILDLGTGSGALIISLLTQRRDATGIATDISAGALGVAARNAVTHGVDERTGFLQGNWFEPLEADARFDLIVCNPPYIETAEISGLEPEVRLYDPVAALDGGADGLAAFRTVFAGAGVHLAAGGAVVVETGSGQGAKVGLIARRAGFGRTQLHTDLAGHDRVVVARAR